MSMTRLPVDSAVRMSEFELVTCPACQHHYSRPTGRKCTLPCPKCHHEMTIVPLIPAEPSGEPFTIEELRGTLRWGIDQATRQAAELTGRRRERMLGIADGYRDVMWMLDLFAEGLPALDEHPAVTQPADLGALLAAGQQLYERLDEVSIDSVAYDPEWWPRVADAQRQWEQVRAVQTTSSEGADDGRA